MEFEPGGVTNRNVNVFLNCEYGLADSETSRHLNKWKRRRKPKDNSRYLVDAFENYCSLRLIVFVNCELSNR
jgi:hypothetical protein